MHDKVIPVDKRRYPRTPVDVALDFRVAGEVPTRCRGIITDLSQSGMTFKTDAVLELGMTLHLRLPSKVEIRGEIRRIDPLAGGQRRYGVKLHKIGYVASHAVHH